MIKANFSGCPLLEAKKESPSCVCARARTLILSWRRTFIGSRIVSPLCWDDFLTFVVMMKAQLVTEQSSPFRRLIGIARGGDLMVHLSPQPVGGMVQCVAGRLRNRVTSHQACFWRKENDCSWEWVKKPTQNALHSFRGTPHNWPLVLLIRIGYSDLVMFVRTEIEGCHMEPRWPATWSHREVPYKHELQNNWI